MRPTLEGASDVWTVQKAEPVDEAVIDVATRSRRDLGPKAPTPRAFRWAALWVLPYLILGISWAIANPPSAAADEHNNLIKILAAGRFDIGEKYEGPPGEEVYRDPQQLDLQDRRGAGRARGE